MNPDDMTATARVRVVREVHADAAMQTPARIAGYVLGAAFTGIGFLLATMLDFPRWAMFPFAAIFGAVGGYAVRRGALMISDGAGNFIGSFTAPSGKAAPYQRTYSYQEALAAAGNVAGALESYEALISDSPRDVQVRLQAAMLYARRPDGAARAAELLREARAIDGATPGQDLYATNRLIDLYLGPLADERRALVELRRLIERYPATDAAVHAREALAKMKHELRATGSFDAI